MIGLAYLVEYVAPATPYLAPRERAKVLVGVQTFVTAQVRRAHWAVGLTMLFLGPIAAMLATLGVKPTILFRMGPIGTCAELVGTLVLLFWFDHPLVREKIAGELP